MFRADSDDRMVHSAKTIAFAHHKGGTGKTTSCLNIAGWLVKLKKKVLVVDLDPQGNATGGLGVDRATLSTTIHGVFSGGKDLDEIILETDSGVYLAPASLDLLAIETHIGSLADAPQILRQALTTVEDYFDYILIDVPPGSTLLMINGIVASENIIIPLDSGVFAFETMETLKSLVIDLNKELGVESNVLMILLKGYSASLFEWGPTYEIKKLLKEFLAENGIPSVHIFTVPFSKEIYKAQMKGMPISHYAPYSDVGRAYKRIAKEILNTEE